MRPVQYQPHDDAYRLDVEVIGANELRGRVALKRQRGFERVDFQFVRFVRSGMYSHTIDFETHQCSAGSCLLVTSDPTLSLLQRSWNCSSA